MFKARKEPETGPLFARTIGTCSLIRQHPLPGRVPVGVPAVQPPPLPTVQHNLHPPGQLLLPASPRRGRIQPRHELGCCNEPPQPPPPLALSPAACKRCPTCSRCCCCCCCSPGPAGCTPAVRAGSPLQNTRARRALRRQKYPVPAEIPRAAELPVQPRGLQVRAGSEQPPPSHPFAGGGIDRGPPRPQLRGFPGAARSTPGCEARRGQQPLRWV